MVTASKIGPQDLPPPGGYGSIQTERIKLRSVVNWKWGVAAFAISNVIGFVFYGMNYRQFRREIIEKRSAKFAMVPLLLAEEDRAFLKQIRKNRDEEEDLMKDYPGWEVGTYFGEAVYQGKPEEVFVAPQFKEYSIHAPLDGNKFLRSYHPLLV